jgi:hypothetical protein
MLNDNNREQCYERMKKRQKQKREDQLRKEARRQKRAW